MHRFLAFRAIGAAQCEPGLPGQCAQPRSDLSRITKLQFEREANGLFDLRHHVGGKLSQLAF